MAKVQIKNRLVKITKNTEAQTATTTEIEQVKWAISIIQNAIKITIYTNCVNFNIIKAFTMCSNTGGKNPRCQKPDLFTFFLMLAYAFSSRGFLCHLLQLFNFFGRALGQFFAYRGGVLCRVLRGGLFFAR